MFVLFWRGLNLGWMLSQVFLPIITAFVFPSGAAVVTFAKYAISLGNRHGSWPPFPIPLVEVAATMTVNRDMIEEEVSPTVEIEVQVQVSKSISKESASSHRVLGHLHSPLLPLASLRRLHLDRGLTDLFPVGAQGRSATLNETLHHGTLRVFIGIPIDLLEELVHRCVTTSVRIFSSCGRLIVGENSVGNAVPVLVEWLVAGRCGGSGGCGGRDRIQRYFTARGRQFRPPCGGGNTYDQERRRPIHPT